MQRSILKGSPSPRPVAGEYSLVLLVPFLSPLRLSARIAVFLRRSYSSYKAAAIMPVPELQKPAPAFTGTAVVKGQFKDIKLSDYKGKYVVLFFYPLDFTFVCPTEIIAFSDRAKEFTDIGCHVIAASTDSHFSHLAWINTPRKQGGLGEMNIPLLADKSSKIARDYGVLDEQSGIAFRGLFIIDDKQNLRQVTINDLPVGRSVDETLRLVQALQYTDKHGEVCPAGWKPGKKAMKADVVGSLEYFKDQ
ncbi:PREDICTED: peroxiredoxin 1 [Wasmannia auropunctata]|uniref:peroxiredoxin 1 n=1 Tax=Wasmannia auropunctata TaxID=64793 RepID=UPI0005ED9A19|nr:PREDICTED: peroxiredoxin 1 [Wasmannia auropunctata]